ncbi:MAG: SDR family NAD(P)-dependent oxidoreductase [Blastomonas fulva]
MGLMQGKVALISGGAEGIGGATGRRIVAEGGSVVLGDIQFDKAKALASELGERAMAVSLDVRDLAQWEAAVQAAVATFGKLTHLVNVAGISEPGAVTDVDLDSWARTIDINLNGTFNGCRAAIPAIADSGEPGAIVNIGSVVGLAPEFGMSVYGATKAFVLFLSQGLNLELAPQGIYVQAVLPAGTRTEIWERAGIDSRAMPDLMGVEELVDAALAGFDRRELVTIPPLHDAARWETLNTARQALVADIRQAHVAERYRNAA